MSGFKHSRKLMEELSYSTITRYVRSKGFDLSRCQCLMVVIEYYKMHDRFQSLEEI